MTHNFLRIAEIAFFALCLAGAVVWAVRKPRDRDPWRDAWHAEDLAYLEEVLEYEIDPAPGRLRRALASSRQRLRAAGTWCAGRALRAAATAGAWCRSVRVTRALKPTPSPLAIEAAPHLSAADRRVRDLLARADREFEDTSTMLRAIR